ncbi:MAG: molybdenum cofactor guanylyltransferase [Proteobacteria bacterium]|nr:molybdenum cofactor guanylyltransferase [Pseudomonadota bacterium]
MSDRTVIKKTGCSGVILSGGRNSRHGGQNKAMIDLRGVRIIDRILSVMRPLFEDLVLVTNDMNAYRDLGINMVSDYFTDRCSLTGIHAGLTAIRNQNAFFVACDAPFIKKELIEKILGMIHPAFDVIVPMTSAGYEPLFAIYSKECLRVIERHLLCKRYKVTDIFTCLNVATVSEEYLREADQNLVSFFNVNTPEMISEAHEISRKQAYR